MLTKPRTRTVHAKPIRGRSSRDDDGVDGAASTVPSRDHSDGKGTLAREIGGDKSHRWAEDDAGPETSTQALSEDELPELFA